MHCKVLKALKNMSIYLTYKDRLAGETNNKDCGLIRPQTILLKTEMASFS